ncbi:MAG: zinc ribbon domain-containing protein [Thermodesulfobacteriota bacterium]|nr:zinc ribbon domain-containing protein [Thermodesulfobacteriota bacterium]
MPIYEYKCRKCNKKFEVFQGITDGEVKACKFCGGPVDKLISLSSFHLKGSGWYVTDYGGKKPSASETPKSNSLSVPGEKSVAPDPKPSSEKGE